MFRNKTSLVVKPTYDQAFTKLSHLINNRDDFNVAMALFEDLLLLSEIDLNALVRKINDTNLIDVVFGKRLAEFKENVLVRYANILKDKSLSVTSLFACYSTVVNGISDDNIIRHASKITDDANNLKELNNPLVERVKIAHQNRLNKENDFKSKEYHLASAKKDIEDVAAKTKALIAAIENLVAENEKVGLHDELDRLRIGTPDLQSSRTPSPTASVVDESVSVSEKSSLRAQLAKLAEDAKTNLNRVEVELAAAKKQLESDQAYLAKVKIFHDERVDLNKRAAEIAARLKLEKEIEEKAARDVLLAEVSQNLAEVDQAMGLASRPLSTSSDEAIADLAERLQEVGGTKYSPVGSRPASPVEPLPILEKVAEVAKPSLLSRIGNHFKSFVTDKEGKVSFGRIALLGLTVALSVGLGAVGFIFGTVFLPVIGTAVGAGLGAALGFGVGTVIYSMVYPGEYPELDPKPKTRSSSAVVGAALHVDVAVSQQPQPASTLSAMPSVVAPARGAAVIGGIFANSAAEKVAQAKAQLVPTATDSTRISLSN